VDVRVSKARENLHPNRNQMAELTKRLGLACKAGLYIGVAIVAATCCIQLIQSSASMPFSNRLS
jgi:hypothetical protein